MGDKNATICIVEDDSAVQVSLVALLECSGYDALAFDSAEAMLESGKAPSADALIIDVRLPGMSGIELIFHLASIGINPPTMIITGHADSQEFDQLPKDQSIEVLSKPCDPNRLLELLRDALQS